MIILDTNVISEIMKDAADPRVLHWFDAQPVESLWTTSVTLGELLQGTNLLPIGRKRRDQEERMALVLSQAFADRLLPFDIPSAHQYRIVIGLRVRAGRPVDVPDAQIAAISRVHNAILATRNVDDFDGAGVTLINPWEEPPTQ